MPFRIIRNDITKMAVEAIVNTANPEPCFGGGTDSAVYEAAGVENLLAARKKIGAMKPGQAAITPGFRLPAEFIIHTVGPVWRGGAFGEEKTLRDCCMNSLRLAKKYEVKSIAFPLISTGVYGFPPELALRTMLFAFMDFLTEEEMEIFLVVFERGALSVSRKLTSDIDSYIDDHYVDEQLKHEYSGRRRFPEAAASRSESSFEVTEDCCFSAECISVNEAPQRKDSRPMEEAGPIVSFMPTAAAESSERFFRPLVQKQRSLDDILDQTEETFQEQLLRLIAEKGFKNAEVYKRANLDKRLFAKIKADPQYTPKKTTALAFAIALHLSLDETLDLIGRAGYTLSPSSKFDLVIRYFIEHKLYDLYEIDTELFERELPMLSSY